MTLEANRASIARITSAMCAPLDLTDVLDTISTTAVTGLDAMTAAILVYDGSTAPRNVSNVYSSGISADSILHTLGPGTFSAVHGAVVMVDDVADLAPRRWSEFRTLAATLGVGGARCFPIVVMSEPRGCLMVHTADHWGARTSTFGQTLADLAGVALSIGHPEDRRVSMSTSLAFLLDQRATIDNAIGIIAERQSVELDEALVILDSLAARRGVTSVWQANIVVTEHNRTAGGAPV